MVKIASFLTTNHESSKRDYLERVNHEKPECMDVASEFEGKYWDGDRKYGYGGYNYDGRWESIAKKLIEYYCLDQTSRVLDIGCGMGHLMFEIKRLTNCEVIGLDISRYAKDKTLDEIKDHIQIYDIRQSLPFDEHYFDLVISIMTLHNLELPELEIAIREIVRVSKNSYVATESYRNNTELFNLQCWALTCQSFFSPRVWESILRRNGYLDRELELLYFT